MEIHITPDLVGKTIHIDNCGMCHKDYVREQLPKNVTITGVCSKECQDEFDEMSNDTFYEDDPFTDWE